MVRCGHYVAGTTVGYGILISCGVFETRLHKNTREENEQKMKVNRKNTALSNLFVKL